MHFRITGKVHQPVTLIKTTSTKFYSTFWLFSPFWVDSQISTSYFCFVAFVVFLAVDWYGFRDVIKLSLCCNKSRFVGEVVEACWLQR